jgi:hypothetical protein
MITVPAPWRDTQKPMSAVIRVAGTVQQRLTLSSVHMHPSGVNLKLPALSPSSDWRVNSLETDRPHRVSGVAVIR